MDQPTTAQPARKPHDACCGHAPASDAPAAGATAHVGAVPAGTGWARFRVASMDCAVEASEIRRAVDGIVGIRSLNIQLGPRTLALDAPAPAVALAVAAMRKAGFDPQPLPAAVPGQAPGAGGGVHDPAHAHAHDHDHDQAHDHDHGYGHAHGHAPAPAAAGHGRLGLALALALGAESLGFFAADSPAAQGAGLGLAALAIWLAGFDVYTKGLVALRHGRLNINALMTVAVTGAFVIGQWPEAAMVMALYAIAEAVEARAVDRARLAIQGLLALAPEEATVRQPDGGWATQPVAKVGLDAVLHVRPGERVPMDGVLTAGSSSVDQAAVTGESIPVDKSVGDAVFAGTINASGSFEFRVTALATNSTLARIIDAVEAAQGTRAPTQGFVDRFAAVYTPAVFAMALAVALLGPWLLGWAWLTAVYKALVLLVIACPCALVISTPVTIVSGLTAAARRGVLIKGGVHLEAARKLKAVALDKTGTLTEGRPKLVDWAVLDDATGTGIGTDRAAAGALAAALASLSDHPVSLAIAAGLGPTGVQASNFRAIAGRGVEAEIDGRVLVLGNQRLIEERGLHVPALQTVLGRHEAAGHSVSVLASAAGPIAWFAVADTLKPSSRAAVAELKALGIAAVMLSGDNQATASAIAQAAGIDEALGNLLPQDKQDAVKALQARYGPTAMTGDGINDAPALAQSDLGIAMGAAGSDTAMEAADVVVMNDDLRRIAEMVRLSRATHAILWQNIALALGIKAAFLLLAVFGSASMWMAVFADMGTSLLVVLNGLRLLKARVAA